ncbi:MAG TPA: PAS domain S-box protein [Candidatus Tectomicrobia bacterium]|jgi:PAS domain S-box-containing protein
MATILIVDDHPTNRQFLTTLLHYDGHRVLEAGDGSDGLAKTQVECPDLIIADILMPTMDGFEFVHRLRADPAIARTPVVFWSAHYLEREARTLAHICDVSHLLRKPCDPEEALRIVAAALGHAPIPAPAVLAEKFDREHLRVVTDKLSQKVEELSIANLKLRALSETGQRLACVRDPSQLLDDYCRAARDIIGAQWVAIGTVADDSDTLHHFSTAGFAPRRTAEPGIPQLHQEAFSALLRQGSTRRLHNLPGDPQALGFPAGYPPIHAFLGTAIASPSRVYGCLVLANKIGANAFSEEDERLVTTLAGQLAVAYENARLYTELACRAVALEHEVAEHQRTAAHLHRAEAQYRTLVEYLPAITYTTTLESSGRTLYISPQVETVLGFSPAEWIADAQLWSMHLHPADRERVQTLLAHSHMTGQPFHAEYRLRTRNGAVVWLLHEGIVVKDDAKGAAFFQGIMLDISERKHAEEALAERTRLAALTSQVSVALTRGDTLRDVLQHCTEAIARHLDAAFARIWTLNQQENVLELQASAGMYTHIDGPHRRVPVGMFKIGLIAQERQPHLTNAVLGDSRVHDQAWAAREKLVAFAGHPLIVADRVVGVMAMFARAPLGQAVLEALATVADQIALGIERKQAEVQRQESEARYRDLFENANDLIYTRDLAGNFTSFNRMAEQVTGYTRAEALRMNLCDLVAPEYLKLAHEMLAESLSGTAPGTTHELVIMAKDGHRVRLEVNSRCISQAGIPLGVQAIARDITERIQLEAQLRQAQKMEAIGTLAGGIAHDFNNILGAMCGYTELALGALPPESEAADDLQQVLDAGAHAAELVEHILTFSRQTEQERVVIPLPPIVKDVLTLLRATVPSTIEIRRHIDPHAGTVLADPTQMHQILMNLCTNAVQAMRDTGGVLEVGLDAIEMAADSTPPQGLTPGSYLRLTVHDTGHGMPPAIMERIFEPFFTTKAVGEGTGLGLSVVHGIVTNHGGSITVDSLPGQGSTFVVYLPRSGPPSCVTDGLEEPVPRGNERILFVDDEPALAQLGERLLTRLGYHVVSSSSSLEALEAFCTAPEAFDLIITDQTMPHLTGEALSHAVRQIRPDIPIVLCTGFSPTMTAEKAQTLSIDAFIKKPLVTRDLGLVVRRVLADRTVQET